MQKKTPWSNWSTVPFLLLALTLTVVAVVFRAQAGAPTPAGQTAVTREQAATATLATLAASDPTPNTIDASMRTAVEPLVQRPRPDFASCIDELCDLGRRTAALAQQDEIEAAKALDQQARKRFAELLEQFPDAGDRSLAMIVDLAHPADPLADPLADAAAADGADPLVPARRIVLQMVLQADLARRHELAVKVDDHSRSDALTQATLDTIAAHAVAAEIGGNSLTGQPFLRLPHEPSVLELVRLAGEQQFPRPLATRLLSTLWDNLQASGERSSAEMSQLALLLLDGDASQCIAACRQLLADARYRALVLSWLRERRDVALANDIAQLAARELPPRDALAVLRELTPLLTHVRGSYLGLGVRAPDLLADAYREHLAANNQPDVRRELVMGVGMLPQPIGLEVAELALANDPSPTVRIQAMFVFTVHGNAEQAERAIGRLLDDPTVAADPDHLGAVVLALPNLEHGDPNVIARLGRRLQSLPLHAASREQLGEILARALPGGTLPGGTLPGGILPGGGQAREE